MSQQNSYNAQGFRGRLQPTACAQLAAIQMKKDKHASRANARAASLFVTGKANLPQHRKYADNAN